MFKNLEQILVRRKGQLIMMQTRMNLDEKVKSKIKFSYNGTVTAKGIGMMIQRKDEQRSFISDVLYVPNMKNNLLSLVQLLEKSYSINMEHSQLKMFDSIGILILKAPLSKNRTFEIGIQIMEHQLMLSHSN